MYCFVKYLCFLSLLILISCSENESSQNKVKRANESIHIDSGTECMKNAACVWEALEPIISNAQGEYQQPSKWQENIAINIVGDDQSNTVLSAVEQTAPYFKSFFPHKITISQSYNFLIFYSDNMFEDLKSKHRDKFNNLLGSDIVFEKSKKLHEANEDQCFSLKFEEDGKINAYFMFIERKEGSDYCFIRFFYSGFMNAASLEVFPFSSLYNDGVDEANITAFDLFLLYVFYNLEYDKDSTVEEIEIQFVEQYPNLTQKFSDIYIGEGY